jgi:APA family basic amino acid/polyamine antiporter
VNVVAAISLIGCIYLFFSLSFYTLLLFFSWAAFGLVIYFAYGKKHSHVGLGTEPGEEA